MLEAPTSNIWWRRGEVLLHAVARPGRPRRRDARRSCSTLEPDGVEEGAFPLERLLAADEAFPTSSIREVMPVVAVDGRADRRRRCRGRPRLGCRPRSRLRSGASERRRFGSAAWRSRTACSCTGRLRGRARSGPPTASSRSSPRRKSYPRLARHEPVAARAGAARRGVRAAAAGEARAARRRSCRCERPRVARLDARRAVVAAAACAARRLRPAARELARRPALARARGARAARRRARLLPRRRAHLDRHATSTASARAEGARAVRLASDRPDAPDERGRQRSPRSARRCGCARRRKLAAARRRRRRLDRDLRLDGAASRHIRSRGRSRSRGTSCSTGSARASRRRAARGRRGRARAPAWSSKMITTRKRLDPSIFDLPVEKMRAGYYTDAYFNHTRATLLARRPASARRHAGLPEEPRVPRRDGRGDRDPQAVRRRLRRR